MKTLPWIIVVILLGVVVLLWLGKVKQETDYLTLKVQSLNKISTLERQLQDLIRRDKETAQLYDTLEAEYLTEKQSATTWKKKYESLKNRPVTKYSDADLDSILSTIR